MEKISYKIIIVPFVIRHLQRKLKGLNRSPGQGLAGGSEQQPQQLYFGLDMKLSTLSASGRSSECWCT